MRINREYIKHKDEHSRELRSRKQSKGVELFLTNTSASPLSTMYALNMHATKTKGVIRDLPPRNGCYGFSCQGSFSRKWWASFCTSSVSTNRFREESLWACKDDSKRTSNLSTIDCNLHTEASFFQVRTFSPSLRSARTEIQMIPHECIPFPVLSSTPMEYAQLWY